MLIHVSSGFLELIAAGPIEIIIAGMVLYDLLGWASLVGEALMLVSMIVPGVMLKYFVKLQERQRKAIDARIGLMVSLFIVLVSQIFLTKIYPCRQKHLVLSESSSSLGWRGYG